MMVGAAVNTGSPNSRSFGGAVNVAVAGGLPFGVAYLLDGAMHNDSQNNANLPLPFPDALQEFRVATTGLTAQNGMHSGASVNAVTKSGTNRFSGNLFEFNRDSRFNATDPFARVVNGERVYDGLSRNQYRRHGRRPDCARQALLLRRLPGHQRPPDARRQHRLRADRGHAARRLHRLRLGGSATAARPVTLRAPFVNNTVNPALFSPAALKLVSYLPQADDQCGQVTYEQPADSKQGQAVGRVDFQQSANHSIFGRYMYTFDKAPAPYAQTGDVLTLARRRRASTTSPSR